jgi:hypothetical protein
MSQLFSAEHMRSPVSTKDRANAMRSEAGDSGGDLFLVLDCARHARSHVRKDLAAEDVPNLATISPRIVGSPQYPTRLRSLAASRTLEAVFRIVPYCVAALEALR